MAVGDFDENGRDDLVMMPGESGDASFYSGQADGTFAAPQTQRLKPFMAFPRAADMDQDGHLDIVASSGTETVGVYFGDGTGGFPRQEHAYVGHNAYSLAVGDFDRDGDQDAACYVFYEPQGAMGLNILENRLLGPDTIAPESQITTPPTVLTQTSSIIPLEWEASDNQTGVWSVEVFYEKDGGLFTSYGGFTESPIDFNTSDTGGEGVYKLYTVAIDGARNEEEAPPAPDTVVTLELVTNVNGWQLLEN